MSLLRLPGFIIGGAPRSGTTWLYAVLDRHPDIAMAKPVAPEPKFFLRDDLYARGLAYYSKTWFAGLPLVALTGEKSTNYLESATAAARIHRDLPDVRLLFVLRNPADRAFSNYLWSRQNGLETESFETALEREEERERILPEELRYARPHALFSRGLYARHLRPYLEQCGRERVHVVRYEDLVAGPGDVAAGLHRFLGVAPRRADGESQEAINAAEAVSASMSPGTRRRLEDRYAEPNRELAALLGPEFPAW